MGTSVIGIKEVPVGTWVRIKDSVSYDGQTGYITEFDRAKFNDDVYDFVVTLCDFPNGKPKATVSFIAEQIELL